jgi:hypothetical protein
MVAPDFRGWSVGAQHFWVYTSSLPDSIFNVEGFKNINIHKITLNGNVGTSNLPVLSGIIVQNWLFNVEIIGQNSVIGGNVSVSPNGFNMFTQPTNPVFALSKYTPSIEFTTPIQSAKKINFTAFYADGVGAEVTTNGQLNWGINCTIYYKFEGE